MIASCELLIAEAQLDVHLVEELDSEGEPIIRTQKQQIQDWKAKMSKNAEYADQIFVQLFSEFVKRKLILIPVHKSVGNNGTGIIEVVPNKDPNTAENPLYFLYYTECKFISPHYQSVRPISKTTDTSIFQPPAESTNIQSGNSSNNSTLPPPLNDITSFEYESTVITSNIWTKLESRRKDFFKSTDLILDILSIL